MKQTQVEQLQGLLAAYLGQESSLREFDEAFVELTWNDDASSDRQVSRLRGEIYLLLAEYTSGHRTEDELQHELRGLAVNPKPIRLSDPTPSAMTSYGSVTQMAKRWTLAPVVSFGVPRVVVPA